MNACEHRAQSQTNDPPAAIGCHFDSARGTVHGFLHNGGVLAQALDKASYDGSIHHREELAFTFASSTIR
jgi:hypothetical protein